MPTTTRHQLLYDALEHVVNNLIQEKKDKVIPLFVEQMEWDTIRDPLSISEEKLEKATYKNAAGKVVPLSNGKQNQILAIQAYAQFFLENVGRKIIAEDWLNITPDDWSDFWYGSYMSEYLLRDICNALHPSCTHRAHY